MNRPARTNPPLVVSLAPAYREAAVEYRRERGWGNPFDDQDTVAGRFNRQVKDCFQEAVVRIYWARLRDRLWRDVGSIAEVLGIDPGRESRWNSFAEGKNTAQKDKYPTLKNFLTLVSFLGVAVGVIFPSGWQASRYGIVETLIWIRNELLGGEPQCPPDPTTGRYKLSHAEFAWIFYLLVDEKWVDSKFRGSAAQELALAQVGGEVAKHFPKERPITVADADKLVLLWSRPWFIFDSANMAELFVRGFSFEEDAAG